MTNTQEIPELPEEIQKWIERITEVEYPNFKTIFKKGAEAMYRHLQADRPNPFGLSDIEIKQLLEQTLKPEEISGEGSVQHDRIKELINWFHRFATGNANPKWLKAHAFEMAYYIATNSGNRFIDLEAVKEKAFLEGVNISPIERECLSRFHPEMKQAQSPDLESANKEIERLKEEVQILIKAYNDYISSLAEETHLLRRRANEFTEQCKVRSGHIEKQAKTKEVLSVALTPFLNKYKQ